MITVLASAKGGSGKTSLTTALATEGARRGARALLIDADTQANATHWLVGGGEFLSTAGDGGRALFRLFVDGDPFEPLRARPNLDLVPAGPRTQSLADELTRMFTHSLDTKKAALAEVRHLLHAATEDYQQVWIDTPPSLQSPALIECFLAAADQVLVPFRASSDHARAAYQVIEQLVRLDELGVDHATPIGVVVFDRDSNATRLEAAVHEELERISAFVPVFDTAVIHRAAPAAAALRFHLTPRELVDAAPDQRTRLSELRRTGTRASGARPSVQREVAERYAQNFADVYDELMRRNGGG
jgi:chromosome partitioning protein